jgi:ABC-type thiamin/hydroxymethylpyrimidine transport system permease subunit
MHWWPVKVNDCAGWNCGWLGCTLSRGIVGMNDVEHGVWFYCVLIVNLVVQPGFTVYVEFLNGVRKNALFRHI